MKLIRSASTRNCHPDLFEWAEHQLRNYRLPLPARRIRDRFGLSPATAIVTAELAGFATEGR